MPLLELSTPVCTGEGRKTAIILGYEDNIPPGQWGRGYFTRLRIFDENESYTDFLGHYNMTEEQAREDFERRFERLKMGGKLCLD